MEDMTLEDHADAALTTAEEVVDRIKWTAEARAKSGRTLSAANVTRLHALGEQAQALNTEIAKLLAAAEPAQESTEDSDAGKSLVLQAFAEFQHSRSRLIGAA